jgi:acetyltransferase-like isoleucine patch superfamily enzyme
MSLSTAARARFRNASHRGGVVLEARQTLGRLRAEWWRLRSRPGRFANFGARSYIRLPLTVAASDRISIGADVHIGPDARLSVSAGPHENGQGSLLSIGDGTVLGRHFAVTCYGSIEIGPDVLASDDVYIVDSDHDYRDATRPILGQEMIEARPVRIERGAFLGLRATILPGVTIGEGAFVGAAAVVTSDVPPRTVVVGNPARVTRSWDPARGEWVKPG